MSASRPRYDTPPTIRPAICPVRSISSVVGMATGGTAPEGERHLLARIVQARIADIERALERLGGGL